MAVIADSILIAKLEARRMFRSPTGYVAGAVLQFILAIVFFSNLSAFEAAAGGISLTDAVIRPLFFSAGTMLLLAAPMLTMHLISEEYRQGTMVILLASPISMMSLAIGKFMGAICLMVFLIILVATMPLGLLLFAPVNMADLGICIVATILFTIPVTAIGMYASSLASRPLLAAMAAFGMLFMLWLSDLPRHAGQSWLAELSDYMSIMSHYEQLLQGLATPADLCYFLLLALFFIMITIRRLHNLRTLH
ncbi:MAG: ABC transporter permease subunit [Candidatus Porifericomitaceae bacterium WSBS_2022_MAG_OTU9]